MQPIVIDKLSKEALEELVALYRTAKVPHADESSNGFALSRTRSKSTSNSRSSKRK